MCRRIAKYGVLICMLTLFCLVSWAQDTVFHVDYFSNLFINDSQKKVVNDGFWGDTPGAGNLCDMIYVFNREQLLTCCGCYVTPNGARDFSVGNDLASIAFVLTDVRQNEVVVKEISSGPKGAASDVDVKHCSVSPDGSVTCGGQCDPRNPQPLIGLHGWAIKTQLVGGGGAPTKLQPTIANLTETSSQDANLGAAELADLAEDCAVAYELGTGFGICRCGGFN